MSRTFRNKKNHRVFSDKYFDELDKQKGLESKLQKKKVKLTPYTKGVEGKFEVEQGNQSRKITSSMKEEVKNANRSLKKGFRQQLKQQLRKELNKIKVTISK